MTDRVPVPKPLVFDDAPPGPATSVKGPLPLSFGEDEVFQAPGAPAQLVVPKPLSFESFPDAAPRPRRKLARPLFESENHPAVRAAIEAAWERYPELYETDGPRIDNHIRKLLPLTLANVSVWADEELLNEARTVLDASALIQKLAQLGVPALLEEVAASGQPPTGLIGKLLNRTASPESFRPALVAARTKLGVVATEGETKAKKLSDASRDLGILLISLVVVADGAGEAPDRSLAETVMHRRTLLQQALRQAELAVLQLEEVRRQGVDLMNQISTMLTVTLPALEMVKSQSR